MQQLGIVPSVKSEPTKGSYAVGGTVLALHRIRPVDSEAFFSYLSDQDKGKRSVTGKC